MDAVYDAHQHVDVLAAIAHPPAGTRLHLCLNLGRFAKARLIEDPHPSSSVLHAVGAGCDRDPRPGGVKTM